MFSPLTEFEKDPYPGKPKILFIGHAVSSHTFAWIDLVQDEALNLRFFALPDTMPPAGWPVRSYIPNRHWGRFNPRSRRVLYTLPNLVRAARPGAALAGAFDQTLLAYHCPERWLARILRRWQPDIVHTLGLEPASYFMLDALSSWRADFKGKWVVTVRGGPDLALNRLLPHHHERIRRVLVRCDQMIADNDLNYRYAVEMGLAEAKICPLGAIPGTGGVNIEMLSGLSDKFPSQRERIILWPKGYESIQGKALPVFEGLEMAWERIQPCEVYIAAVIQDEIRIRFQQLPAKIREKCHLLERVPRDELLRLMGRARAMLAPSLSDGVPNSLYEAMAAGACPIVSPLETLTDQFVEKQNVLYARNLYPADIADALVNAMNDPRLVDHIAETNRKLVARLADRKKIGEKIRNYYHDLVAL